MPTLIQRVLEPPAGMKSKLAGLFVAQLDDLTRRLTEETRGASDDELAWQPGPGTNTIGMLLAHVAFVEVGWINRAIGREWDEATVLPFPYEESGMPLPPGGAPPPTLAGKDLAYFDDLLARARAHTKQVVGGFSDGDVERTFRVRRGESEYEISVEWVLYHIVEHLAGHYYQINLLRHLYRDTEIVERGEL